MKTSSINIIGTISIAGRIKENPEIHVAENPNPLKPLIIEAINTINIINENSDKLKLKKDNKSTYLLPLKSALKVEITIIIRKMMQTKFIVFQLVKLINIPADRLAIA